MDIEITKSYDDLDYEPGNYEPGTKAVKNEGCDQEVTDDCSKASR